jgi:hypothetical protein
MVAGTPTILSEAELDAVRQRARELSEDPEGVRR